MSSRREGRRKSGPGKGLRRSGAVLASFRIFASGAWSGRLLGSGRVGAARLLASSRKVAVSDQPLGFSCELLAVSCWLSALRFQVLFGGWAQVRLDGRRPRRVSLQQSWGATRAESAQRSAFWEEEHEQRSAARK